MTTDPIADMLTRIRNASLVNHKQVVMPSSKMKVAIAQILKAEGFIDSFNVTDAQPQANLVLRLKYTGRGDAVIRAWSRKQAGQACLYQPPRHPSVRAGLGSRSSQRRRA